MKILITDSERGAFLWKGWGSPAPAALSRRMPLLPGGQPGAAVPLLPKKPGLLVPQPAHAAGGTGLSRAARAGGGVSLALRKIPVSAQHGSRRGADGFTGKGRTALRRPGRRFSPFHEAPFLRAAASVRRGRGERSLSAERARPDRAAMFFIPKAPASARISGGRAWCFCAPWREKICRRPCVWAGPDGPAPGRSSVCRGSPERCASARTGAAP